MQSDRTLKKQAGDISQGMRFRDLGGCWVGKVRFFGFLPLGVDSSTVPL